MDILLYQGGGTGKLLMAPTIREAIELMEERATTTANQHDCR